MVYSADVGGSTGACVVAARLIDTRHDSNISLADRSGREAFPVRRECGACSRSCRWHRRRLGALSRSLPARTALVVPAAMPVLVATQCRLPS